MDFPGFVEEHPAISVVLVLAVVAGLGVTAVFYSQSTFVDDSTGDPRSWQKAVNPETGQVFDSKQGFQDYVQETGRTVPDELMLEYRDGVLHYKAPCGTVGGGSTR